MGTKCDVEGNQRCVTSEQAAQLASELNLKYFEVSSITGHNVTEVFHELIRDLRMLREKEGIKRVFSEHSLLRRLSKHKLHERCKKKQNRTTSCLLM